MNLSTEEVSSFSPATSPCVRRRFFLMASTPTGLTPAIESLTTDCFERALLPGPDLPGFEPVGRFRGFHHWFTSIYTFPSRLPVSDRLIVSP